MSVTLFPNFAHSVDDPPQDSWTVEELFQWSLLQSLKAVDDKGTEDERDLRVMHAEGIKAIRQTFETGVIPPIEQSTDVENLAPNNKPEMPSQNAQALGKPLAAAAPSAPVSSLCFSIKVLRGEHTGKFYDLKVTRSVPCLLGRSKGKKFRGAQGISLYKDLEVSTSHGKFTLGSDGNLFFIDTGSTNGSNLVLPPSIPDEEETKQVLDPDKLYELHQGSLLLCGQSLLEIHF